ncbi:MAG: hypothetical protein NTV06_06190 [candidate division Zixibacteria bacterium]|nr:hypothetical protein [candidate division Zixibacteria bacterium]
MASIKDIMAQFKLRRLLKQYEGSLISIPADMRQINNILVCLPPEQRELTMIKQLLPELSRIFPNREMYLLASPGSPVYGIFPRKGYRIMTPSGEQLTWSGLAKKSYINLLKQNNYDLILDLNLTPNLFVQSILLAFSKAIKIGGGNNLGAPYYNLEVKSKYLRDEKNIYKSIIDMIGKLKGSADQISS